VPGRNCTVRVRSRMLVIRCLECGAVRRFPVK
jgi:RNase P subunit RPR2